MQRHELTSEQWELVKHLFPDPPRSPKGGRPPRPARDIVNAIFWILHTGAPWRDLPPRYGKWQSVYHRFNAWTKDGTIEKALHAMQMKLDENGYIDWSLWCVDGTNVRATRSAAGGRKKAAPESPPTTLSDAAGAGSARRSTWLLTAEAFHLPPTSPRGKSTSRRNSKPR